MIEVVPAILTDDPKEFLALAERLVAAGVRRVHLDIGDGSFIPAKTISGFEELTKHDLPIDWDVHLMVNRPEEQMAHWYAVARADRFLIHVESTESFGAVAEDIHGHDRHVGAVVNPGTERALLEQAIPHCDLVQFMTVIPGTQGGQFLPRVLPHVVQTREDHPELELAVDGGVTPETAGDCAAAGANILVSGSYVRKSADAATAVEAIQQAAIDALQESPVLE